MSSNYHKERVIRIFLYNDIIDQNGIFNNQKSVNCHESVITLDDSRVVAVDKTTGEAIIKSNDWKSKKINNLELANSYKRIYANSDKEKKYIKVKDCSTWLEFARHLETSERRLEAANFCKDRLCPICNWRRSLKVYSQASAVMKIATKDYEFLFLTLTQKNVKSEELEEEINRMMEGFKKFTKRKEFKNAVHGFFRALEITYNKKRDDYHPHFHIILAVKPSYFKKKDYLKQKDWCRLWQESMKLDYTPTCDVRKFKAQTEKELSKSLAEATKYTIKDADYLIKGRNGKLNPEQTDKVVKTFAESLAYRRLIAWGGVLRDIYKSLNLDDPEKGDLVITDSNQEDVRDGLWIIEHYRWSVGMSNYVLTNVEKK